MSEILILVWYSTVRQSKFALQNKFRLQRKNIKSASWRMSCTFSLAVPFFFPVSAGGNCHLIMALGYLGAHLRSIRRINGQKWTCGAWQIHSCRLQRAKRRVECRSFVSRTDHPYCETDRLFRSSGNLGRCISFLLSIYIYFLKKRLAFFKQPWVSV